MKYSVGFFCLRLILCILLALPVQILSVLTGDGVGIANTPSTSTQVKHKPLGYFVSGKRILISAEVTDKEGVKLARCYFRSKDGAGDHYFFIRLLQKKEGEKNVYEGIIPAPSQGTQQIEYVFLIVNERNQMVKTEKFSVIQKESGDVPSWQTAHGDEEILISTEIDQQLISTEEFEKKVVIEIAVPSQRFGIAAGLYGALQTAATRVTGDAAGAVNDGDIKTDTGGISWWWAAGGAVVIAGLAAAVGGGRGSPTPATTTRTTTPTTTTSTSTTSTSTTTTVLCTGQDQWSTGRYTNNLDISRILSIPCATSLRVTVTGSTESNFDYFYIYDYRGVQIKRYSGTINDTFTVGGSSIRARLTTDYSVVTNGVTVTIRPQ